jgi:hypothetical protein
MTLDDGARYLGAEQGELHNTPRGLTMASVPEPSPVIMRTCLPGLHIMAARNRRIFLLPLLTAASCYFFSFSFSFYCSLRQETSPAAPGVMSDEKENAK